MRCEQAQALPRAGAFRQPAKSTFRALRSPRSFVRSLNLTVDPRAVAALQRLERRMLDSFLVELCGLVARRPAEHSPCNERASGRYAASVAALAIALIGLSGCASPKSTTHAPPPPPPGMRWKVVTSSEIAEAATFKAGNLTIYHSKVALSGQLEQVCFWKRAIHLPTPNGMLKVPPRPGIGSSAATEEDWGLVNRYGFTVWPKAQVFKNNGQCGHLPFPDTLNGPHPLLLIDRSILKNCYGPDLRRCLRRPPPPP